MCSFVGKGGWFTLPVFYLCAMYRMICLMVLLICFQSAGAQKGSADVKLNILTLNLGYGAEWPGGDLAQRFGQSLSFHSGMEWVHKSKYSFGLDFSYFFGDKIKEDVFAPYRNENGLVQGINGVAADLFIRERGAYVGIQASSILFPTAKHSGFELSLGAGMLYHKLHFVDDSRSVFLAEKPYSTGLDRLTRGFALRQELAYQLHSEKKALHFHLGFYVTEAFTTQVRKFNFDTGLPASESTRNDLLYGVRLVWMLPLYKASTVPVIKYF